MDYILRATYLVLATGLCFRIRTFLYMYKSMKLMIQYWLNIVTEPCRVELEFSCLMTMMHGANMHCLTLSVFITLTLDASEGTCHLPYWNCQKLLSKHKFISSFSEEQLVIYHPESCQFIIYSFEGHTFQLRAVPFKCVWG